MLVAEAIGTMMLVAAVIGSGIMAARLSDDIALVLLCNTIATGTALIVLILIFAPLSGAHFNPAVTLSFALRGAMTPQRAGAYISVQIIGGIAGTILAHAMFTLPLISAGATSRSGPGQWLGEMIATAGLLMVIAGCAKRGSETTAYAVGLFIASAYWFTASTAFANPAVTMARALTASFTGITPLDALWFIAAEILAAILVTPFIVWLFQPDTADFRTPA
jgi:glycerol uptake facilitator-like aquaporin